MGFLPKPMDKAAVTEQEENERGQEPGDVPIAAAVVAGMAGGIALSAAVAVVVSFWRRRDNADVSVGHSNWSLQRQTKVVKEVELERG